MQHARVILSTELEPAEVCLVEFDHLCGGDDPESEIVPVIFFVQSVNYGHSS